MTARGRFVQAVAAAQQQTGQQHSKVSERGSTRADCNGPAAAPAAGGGLPARGCSIWQWILITGTSCTRKFRSQQTRLEPFNNPRCALRLCMHRMRRQENLERAFGFTAALLRWDNYGYKSCCAAIASWFAGCPTTPGTGAQEGGREIARYLIGCSHPRGKCACSKCIFHKQLAHGRTCPPNVVTCLSLPAETECTVTLRNNVHFISQALCWRDCGLVAGQLGPVA